MKTFKYFDESTQSEMTFQADHYCFSCRRGSTDNISDIVGLCTIKDTDTGKLVARGYLCESHFDMYLDDGYDVIGSKA